MKQNKLARLMGMSALLIIPMASFAGGIKGPLFSDEVIYGFFSIIAVLYLGSLCFGIVYANRGKVWQRVLSSICTSLLFFPSLLVACVVPIVGIPSAIFTGLNFLLIRKKVQLQDDEEI